MMVHNDKNEVAPKVSVVIPTYNRAGMIKGAIQSVLSQTFKSLELIVVDDCSTDKTERIVNSICDERIKYIKHKTNKGASAARNTGMKASRGDYIAFLDSDDLWLQNKVQKQIDYFKRENDDLGLCVVGIADVRTKRYKENQLSTSECKELLHSNPVGGCSAAMIKQNVVETIGYFDECLPALQDRDYWLRICSEYDVGRVSEILVIKGTSNNQITLSSYSRCVGELSFLKKHKSKYDKKGFSDYLYSLAKTILLNKPHRRRAVISTVSRSIQNDWFSLKKYSLLVLSLLPPALSEKAKQLKRGIFL
jgi:glycosyltransferase involved in cell wall biosynthesis